MLGIIIRPVKVLVRTTEFEGDATVTAFIQRLLWQEYLRGPILQLRERSQLLEDMAESSFESVVWNESIVPTRNGAPDSSSHQVLS